MSKTSKVVLIIAGVLVVCLIGAGITVGVMLSAEGNNVFKGFFSRTVYDIDESADLDLDGIEKVNIDCTSGRIIVMPGEPRAELTGRIVSGTEQEKFLVVSEKDGTLGVRCDFESTFPNFFTGDVVLTVYLPEDMAVDTGVSGASATADISGITFGDLSVSSSSGEVNIRDCSGGAMNIGLSSGEVQVSGADFKSVEVSCMSGDVSVENTAASVKINSTSGVVRVTDADGAVDIQNTSGDVLVSQSKAEISSVRIHVVSGGVVLRLNPDTAFDLAAESTSGSLRSDFDLTVSGSVSNSIVGENVSGTVNGGGAAVDLSTVSGDIRVEKSN